MSIQQAKKDYITAVAADMFLKKGIADVTIKDVTEKAGVGEATIYRYFSTKQNLVIGAAGRMADEIHLKYFDLTQAKRGIDKLEAFYGNFLKIFKERREYYRFIFEFDATVASQDGLENYESTLLPYMQVYLDAYRLGLTDGTVEEIDDIGTFYLSTTHALMGLCKKLTMNSVVLDQDKNGEEEIRILIDVIIYRLKTCASNTSKNK